MTFAAPLFLLAALAAAIPIVMHMINRQKAKDLPFATLRFLKISVEKTRRRKRIHDVLLMAIRAAVLLLIAAGLAQPAMTNLSALWGGARSAIVIILDNSASMGTIDQDRIRLDTALAAATQILDQLVEGDQAAMLVTCGPAFPESDKLDRTQDNVRRILGQCRVSYERADLDAKVKQARVMLADSETPNKQIYVLSDMQRVSWEPGQGDGTRDVRTPLESRMDAGESNGQGPHPNPLPKGEETESAPTNPESRTPSPELRASSPEPQIPIILVDCNRKPKPNVAVEGIDVEAAVAVVGLPVKATVTLLNASMVARQPRVELLIDGVKQSGSPELNVPPEGRVKHDFLFTFESGGLHRGEVRLVGEDGSKYDDRRFFTIEVDQAISVAIVRTGRHEIPYLDDAYYLERALAPDRAESSALQTTILTADDLSAEPLEKYKVIFCVNLPALSPQTARRLQDYVAGGGNVVWTCGDNVDIEAYNRMNEQTDGQLLPAPLVDVRAAGAEDGRDSWHVSFLDKAYPAFRRLIEPPSLYESILVYKHVRMAADDPKARVLARLDDAEPLLVSRHVGNGNVLMLGATVHIDWSNLPLRPIFLPLLMRLTFDLAQAEQATHNVIAGRPLALRLPIEPHPTGVEVFPPDGETLRLKTEPAEGGEQTFRYADTHQIGVYVLRLLGVVQSPRVGYSVNFDPDEANAATIGQEELQERFEGTPLVFAENPDDLSSTFALLREGRSLWGLMLTLVLVGLVFETLVSNRLGPKQRNPAAEQTPPGMRRLSKKA